MCTVCGCSNPLAPIDKVTPASGITFIPEGKSSEPVLRPERPSSTEAIHFEHELLAKNDRFAEENRRRFRESGILALNLMSSPGSGKTTLLERTIRDLSANLILSVIEGDQETARDAERIRATGASVLQVNTGAGCHLDADMISRGLARLSPPARSVLMIENVGNLVCPALFDLGERAKVVVLSVTEGEDKPLKYPHMFQASEIMILNKIDLLPYLSFDVAKCLHYARQVNPELKVFQVSATQGEGLPDWYAWVREQADAEAGVARSGDRKVNF
jgi:hydrogenase nickel incorporation protein HypB